MEKVTLNAQVREKTGKSASARLRREGLIPAVVYKGGKKAAHIKLSARDFGDVLATEAGENVIIALRISGEAKRSEKTVIIKELQHHPIKEDIIHVDFNEILLTEKIQVKVPIELKGESAGVKEGGVLEHILWELEVECLPMEIPEKVSVDVSGVNIGDTIYVRDLVLPGAVNVLTDAESPVISVVMPKEEVAEEAPAEGEEMAEPEVIKEKKKEEAPAEGEAAEAEEKPKEK